MSIRDLNQTIRGHEHPPGLGFALHHNHPVGYLPYVYILDCPYNINPVVGRVYLMQVMVPYRMTLDQIMHGKGNPVGNVRVGLYESVNLRPDGGALLVESGSVAMPAGFPNKHAVNIADTPVEAGLYFAAVEFSDATHLFRAAGTDELGGDEPIPKYYDLGAFGPLTDPCPVTIDYDRGPGIILRIKSVP